MSAGFPAGVPGFAPVSFFGAGVFLSAWRNALSCDSEITAIWFDTLNPNDFALSTISLLDLFISFAIS